MSPSLNRLSSIQVLAVFFSQIFKLWVQSLASHLRAFSVSLAKKTSLSFGSEKGDIKG